MAETRKLAAILVSEVVGYSKLAGSDEERTLAPLRALRSDLIDSAIRQSPHHHYLGLSAARRVRLQGAARGRPRERAHSRLSARGAMLSAIAFH